MSVHGEEQVPSRDNPALGGITFRRGVDVSDQVEVEVHNVDEDPILIGIRKKLRLIVEDLEEIYIAGLSACEDINQINIFRGMHCSAQGHFERFMSLFEDLTDNTGTGEPGVSDKQLRAAAKRYYYGSCTHAETLNSSVPTRRSYDNTLNTSGSSFRPRAKLPIIKLPDFDGLTTSWQRFKETFISLVINDIDLTLIDKFHYLVASLKDSAMTVIADIPITEANFPIAWQALLDSYDNPRLIATAYLDQLLNITPLSVKPNNDKLKQVINSVVETIAAFRQIKVEDRADFLLFYLARRCFDKHTREAFEQLHDQSKFPSYDEFIKFLRSRCLASELATGTATPTTAAQVKSPALNKFIKPAENKMKALVASTSSPVRSPSGHQRPRYQSSSKYNTKPSQPVSRCPACNDTHPLAKCPKFLNMGLDERQACISKWNGCRCCLYSSHQTWKCPSDLKCFFCQKRHNTLLHMESLSERPLKDSTRNHFKRNRSFNKGSSHLSSSKPKPDNSTSGNTLSATNPQPTQIILGTALCYILDKEGKPHTMRLAMDSGSQFSFLSRQMANKLGLNVKTCNINILGIGQTPFHGFTGKTECRLLSQHEPMEVSTQALVVDTITSDLPNSPLSQSSCTPFEGYTLADPEFWDPRPVDFLLGSDLFADILNGDIVTVGQGLPKLIGTIFGYVIMGRMLDLSQAKEFQAFCATAKTDLKNENLLKDLQKLWELEEPPSVQSANPADLECEEHFQKTHYRLPTGRYVVRLPFKGPPPDFPSTRWMAIKRLSNIEGRLQRDKDQRVMYQDFMIEYEKLGHMSLAKQPGKYIIPHHGVMKADGDRHKIRVVFDASARTGVGSLNDYLHSGPKLQNNIVVILLNFRLHAICFTTDLVKMFRQISVDPQDRVYQHILWRDNPSNAVEEFELSTVTYGQAPAPYLAQRCVRQLIEDDGHAFPNAAFAIKEDMYVDDIATGAETLEEALNLKKQIIGLMSKGEFTLSKWMSNNITLLTGIKQEDTEDINSPKRIQDPEDIAQVKILGLQWDPKLDIFSFEVSTPDTIFTKRAVLAAVARIYDPLGFLGPIVIVAKSIIQSAWKSGLDWDTPFTEPLQARWKEFVRQLQFISEIRIPRWVLTKQSLNFDILIFGDASEIAYCAAAYLRINNSSEVKVSLLLSKTKLAPVKPLTIPRLELSAALLAIKLFESLDKFIGRLPIPTNLHFFSDSTVVLGWLHTPPHQLKTFVANRVVRILKSSKLTQWSHVRSEDNPSDLGSRGVSAEGLIKNELWFHGPEWAALEPSEWPSHNKLALRNFDLDSLPERKDTSCLVVNKGDNLCDLRIFEMLNKFSTYTSLIRTFSWVLRFINNCRSLSTTRLRGGLSAIETQQAQVRLIKFTQELEFNSGKVITSKDIPKNLQSLSPFLDSDGVLRVGGRLSNASLPFVTRHPYILPAKVHLTVLLIDYYHRSLMHPGPSLLLSTLRRKYWIVNARNQVRSYTVKCVKCRRLRSTPCQPRMADLPVERLQEGRAFSRVGVDFAGPFWVRDSLRRKAGTSKCYLAVFICLGSRAIHLEAVSSISTSAFCAALDRFVSRRGIPDLIMSDNGTNFVGAANHLKELAEWYRQANTRGEITDYATKHQITWRFIPPHAPHWGGCWEAGVRSAKKLLRSAYGEGAFTFEELSTLFARVEAILNSRPICPLSDDPDDLDALTPGHLLIGTPLIALPEYPLVDIREGRLDRWQLIQQRTQMFWKRWKAECMHQLQVRTKWCKSQRNLEINDLVLIKGEDTDRQRWPLGRIINVFPGTDSVVRVAEVRTNKGIFKRPATKLILILPQEENTPTNDSIT